jgi:hypothetical protein
MAPMMSIHTDEVHGEAIVAIPAGGHVEKGF